MAAETLFVRCFDSLSEVRALVAAGGLNSDTAPPAVELATNIAALSELGSSEQLSALEVLESCSRVPSGAESMASSAHQHAPLQVLLWVASGTQAKSQHQMLALSGLSNMSCAMSFAMADCAPVLTQALLFFACDEQFDEQHQRLALVALYHLSCEPCNLDAMARAGAIPAALALLSPFVQDTAPQVPRGSAGVGEREHLALCLLLNFSSGRHDTIEQLADQGSVSVLIRLLVAGHGDVLQQAASNMRAQILQALCTMTTHNARVQAQALEAGLAPHLLALLAAPECSANMHLWALRALGNLAHAEHKHTGVLRHVPAGAGHALVQYATAFGPHPHQVPEHQVALQVCV